MDNKILWPGWETVRIIGRGSFGAVYEIERDIFGDKEKAALKVIRIPQNEGDIEEMYSAGYDEESITSTFNSHLKSIVAEYSLMRKMNGSANVVNCDDVRYVQHEDGIGWDIFIKMELLTPLSRALTGKISENTVIKVAKDLCHALVLCRKYDIIHRDIKPQNIFVSENGDYKLGDFGIAKTVEKTSGGTKIGTYKYMAPEVYNNQPYGAASDIYSLGLVLYWMLNERRMPFLPLPPQRLTGEMEESARLRRFRGEALPAPANGSAALKAIVLKACAYDPRERFATADEMLAALTALSGEPVIAPPRPDNGAEEDATIITGRRFAEKAGSGEDFTNNATVISAKPKKSEGEPILKDRANMSRRVDVPDAQRAVRPKSKTKHQSRHEKSKKIMAPILAIIAVAVCFAMALFLIPAMEDKEAEEDYNANDYLATASPDVEINENPGVDTVTPDEEHIEETNTEPASQDEDSPVNLNAEIISASWGHTAGLKTDGTVLVTGRNNSGQSNVGDWRDIVSVCTGYEHTVGLKSDGTLVAVGLNHEGQCNINGWRNVVAVRTSYEHTVGLKSDGTVVAVGQNDAGQCNISGWRGIVAIGAGYEHTVGLKSDGTVVATEFVGNYYNGQCDVSDWRNIVAVSAGNCHTLGLKSDGTVVAAGRNLEGECDVSDWRDIVAISAGGMHTVGLKSDGTVVAVGRAREGQCDVSDWRDIVAISAGYDYTVGLKSDGTVVAVGDNYSGVCNVSEWRDIATGIPAESYIINTSTGAASPEESFSVNPRGAAIGAGMFHTVALKSDGTVVAVGDENFGQCDVSDWRDIAAVCAGGTFTVGLRSDGTVLTAGTVNGNNLDISDWRDIVAVDAGDMHVVGIKADGTVVAAGENYYGQCAVGDWRDIVAVSAGSNHTVGLKSDGTVVAIGYNNVGQCDVSDWRDIVAVSAGGSHTVGLKSDGTVMAVGHKFYDQCNVSGWWDIVAVSAGAHHTVGLKSDGSMVATVFPEIAGGYYGQSDVGYWWDVVAVSAGAHHTVGLKSDGTVVAVGFNGGGQCDVNGMYDIRLPEK